MRPTTGRCAVDVASVRGVLSQGGAYGEQGPTCGQGYSFFRLLPPIYFLTPSVYKCFFAIKVMWRKSDLT